MFLFSGKYSVFSIWYLVKTCRTATKYQILNTKYWLAPVLALFAMTEFAHAAAWTLPQDKSQMITNVVFYRTDEIFSPSGHRNDIPAFQKWEVNPYYEYGYRDDLTLGLSPFFHYLRQEQPGRGTDTNLGMAETEAFARYRFFERGHTVLSVQPLIKLPSLYTNDDPKAGRSQMDAELAVLGGYTFEWMGKEHFTEAKAAYRHRFGELDDQYKFDATVGFTLTPDWQLMPKMFLVRDAGKHTSQTSVSGQSDYDLSKLQLSAVYHLDEAYAVEFGGFRHMDGENTGAGGGVLASFWVNW